MFWRSVFIHSMNIPRCSHKSRIDLIVCGSISVRVDHGNDSHCVSRYMRVEVAFVMHHMYYSYDSEANTPF
jgi:hypothetical protein